MELADHADADYASTKLYSHAGAPRILAHPWFDGHQQRRYLGKSVGFAQSWEQGFSGSLRKLVTTLLVTTLPRGSAGALVDELLPMAASERRSRNSLRIIDNDK